MAAIEFSFAPVESEASVAASWQAMERAARPPFFLSWAWIGTWLATLPQGLRLELVTARRGGATAGLALIATNTVRQFLRAPATGLHLHSTGDSRWDCIAIEHNGFLCPSGDAAALAAAFGAWFAAGGAGEKADELRLPGVASPLANDFLDRAGLLHSTQIRPGFTVDLARVRASGDFAALLSSNARQQLRRTKRDFAAQGECTVAEARDRDQALAWFGAMKELHVRSWQRRGRAHAFSAPYFETFHRALIGREFGAGAIQLLRAEAGGFVLGYLYNFRRDGRIYSYQSGFDDADPKRRPGALCQALAVEHNAARGEAVYDFLAGENRLKASYATGRYELAWQVVRLPRFKYRLESMARRAKQAVFGPR